MARTRREFIDIEDEKFEPHHSIVCLRRISIPSSTPALNQWPKRRKIASLGFSPYQQENRN